MFMGNIAFHYQDNVSFLTYCTVQSLGSAGFTLYVEL